jgi:hypothetical protein
MKPTVHVTNHSSRRLHGPGRRLTIMAKPRQWEHGDGAVPAATPNPEWLFDVRAGEIPMAAYRDLIDRRLAGHDLTPGRLMSSVGAVVDGDSLCCACSRDEAAAGRCHRVWVAAALARAGWRVVLDGAELANTDSTR